MRQLLPFPCDPVDPAVLYGDLPPARTRPAVRLNMIASIDGATAVAGLSGGLGGPADQALFAVLRSQADVVLVAAGTVRAERVAARRAGGQSVLPIMAVMAVPSREARALQGQAPGPFGSKNYLPNGPEASRARSACLTRVRWDEGGGACPGRRATLRSSEIGRRP
jgi:hypothetical protein